VTSEGLTIIGSIAPGFPVSESGYGARAYGNTQPGLPSARWLLVRPDGNVTAFAGKVEYGQNIRTGFAVEVADELRVPLEQVGVVLGDTESTPWDMGTFGSQSTARARSRRMRSRRWTGSSETVVKRRSSTVGGSLRTEILRRGESSIGSVARRR